MVLEVAILIATGGARRKGQGILTTNHLATDKVAVDITTQVIVEVVDGLHPVHRLQVQLVSLILGDQHLIAEAQDHRQQRQIRMLYNRKCHYCLPLR